MDIELLKRHFAGIGARVKVGEAQVTRWSNDAGINIRADARGEFFDIKIDAKEPRDYRVIDLRSDQRHLLLLSERDSAKFLCGFDERHWFVCAVPGEGVTSVRRAMEALQPAEVRVAVERRVKRSKNRLRRRNEAFVRQGEWFFIPEPELTVEDAFVSRNEPLSRRRGSKPHMCQYAYRTSGELVMVCSRHPAGVPMESYGKILRQNPKAKNWDWRQMRRNAEVYVRGRVWHPDHKTVILRCWHRVLMNTENLAPGRQAVTFLD
ncbi:MAG: hypothetical protein L0Y75_09125 [Acidobacteria bacterium]|nr:hypothetical protein [Acidobacteriota bacterium]